MPPGTYGDAGKIEGIRLPGQQSRLVIGDDVDLDSVPQRLVAGPGGIRLECDPGVLLPAVEQVLAALRGHFGGETAARRLDRRLADDVTAVIGQGNDLEGLEGFGQVNDAAAGIDDLDLFQLFELIGPRRVRPGDAFERVFHVFRRDRAIVACPDQSFAQGEGQLGRLQPFDLFRAIGQQGMARPHVFQPHQRDGHAALQDVIQPANGPLWVKHLKIAVDAQAQRAGLCGPSEIGRGGKGGEHRAARFQKSASVGGPGHGRSSCWSFSHRFLLGFGKMAAGEPPGRNLAQGRG